MQKRNAQQHKKSGWKPPVPARGWRLLIYFGTVFLCVLAVVSISMDFCVEWLRYAVYTAAFCALCISGYYLIAVSRREVRDSIRRTVSRHSVLKNLCADYYQRSFWLALPGFALNVVFAVFNALIGVLSMSAWYISFAVYYMFLCLMRAWLLYDEFLGKNKQRAKPLHEWRLYQRCGVILMLMSIALGGVVVLMLLNGRTKSYPGYLIYVVAMYTFWKVITAAVSVVRARKLKSPRLRALKNIGYADALMSVLSLQTAMFAAFGGEDQQFPLIMNTLTGSAVCLMVLLTGGGMVITANRRLRGRGREERSGKSYDSYSGGR